MSLQEVIRRRGITEVVHYTTSSGLLGILDERLVKARHRLSDDKRIEFILKLNTPRVRDRGWEDYVNLSITRINSRLFDYSIKAWHSDKDVNWCVLAFDPEILTHDRVIFTTTNNIYPSVVRAGGVEGFEGMFGQQVIGRYQSVHKRSDEHPPDWTTDVQAEVLYPGELSTNFLRRIYVPSEEDHDSAMGQIAAVRHDEVEIVIDSDLFQV